MTSRVWLAVAIAMCGCAGARPPPKQIAGDLPADVDAIVDDLIADDVRIVEVREINETVLRFELERRGRTFRVKWKPMGRDASEVQDGFDGNNAPRCEVAAWRINRLLFGEGTKTDRDLVAPVVVRAFHRDVPCDRACAHVPRLPDGGKAESTFRDVNDHLVIGAVTFWIDGVGELERFEGGLWDRARFDRDPIYRRSFSDLVLFLHVIGHGDANYSSNFLAREPSHDRLYSIDNGRAFDGVPFYTDEGDPDWAPFARIAPPDRLVAPSFSRRSVERIETLRDVDTVARALRVVSAIDLTSGRSIRDPASAPELIDWLDRPETRKIGRGAFLTRDAEGRTWLLLGIGETGIRDVAARAGALSTALRSGIPTFD